MAQRPISITIIAWLLIVLTALNLVVMAVMGSKIAEQMHVSLQFLLIWGVVSAIVTLVCVYGFFKGQPWSRVLYVLWSVVGLIVSWNTSPSKVSVLVGLIILIVVAFFLFRENANDWFQARGFMLKREVAPSERR
jgi:uncharacterized membrane protein YeiH